MPTKPKPTSLKSKFVSWLRIQHMVANRELSDVDQEMEVERLALILENVPSSGREILEYDLASLPHETVMALARLGLAYKAYERALFRYHKVRGAIEGLSPDLEDLYDEFRRADEWNESSHTAMLRGFVQGMNEDLPQLPNSV